MPYNRTHMEGLLEEEKEEEEKGYGGGTERWVDTGSWGQEWQEMGGRDGR